MRSTPSTTPVPPERRVLAALGPRMLELAAARSAGAHPYFVPVEHTARARTVLGPGPLLAPEVAVVLETDPARARELARRYASTYLSLPNYTQNLRTFGFGDDDIDGGGSDRLIDAVIPWGDADDGGGGRPRPPRRGSGPRLHPGRRRPRGLPAGRVPGPRRRRSSPADAHRVTGGLASDPTTDASARCASAAASARKARPRWDTASFSAGCISAKVRPSPPSGTNTGS